MRTSYFHIEIYIYFLKTSYFYMETSSFEWNLPYSCWFKPPPEEA